MHLKHLALSTWAASVSQDLHNIRGITFGTRPTRGINPLTLHVAPLNSNRFTS